MSKEDKIQVYDSSQGCVVTVDVVRKTDAEWKRILTAEQYEVTRAMGTERPFTGACAVTGMSGTYRCVSCGLDLFACEKKFESGTGWPSFLGPVSQLNIRMRIDNSHGMARTEVLCARCGAHLGHVFDDGPMQSNKRYCINSIALALDEK